ncbi:hypothetical protein [Maribacter sp. HTCC2170]|uniref:hypothetical protein n=1 Tax=Maribacter sp. (strain HTCC2170 / KCCM 42371) TaxID=313603 RepID=UPI00006BD384|nr:hypothetical protein [Maribacter sp. HTCC2170]EAR02511.1 hypothetical protein FB2170_04470 [Maribacter sp. HTCC2170]
MGQKKPDKNNICKFLRARNPYGMMEGGDHPWLLLDDANTICWCITSSGGVGPDNGLVSPSHCSTKGRSCFVSEESNDQ